MNHAPEEASFGGDLDSEAGQPGFERPQLRGWPAFAGWSLVGATLALSLVGIASIGLLVLPFALALLWLAYRYLAASTELLGLAAGAGLLGVIVGFINLDYYAGPCPDGQRRTENGIEGCDGFSPVPWFVAGSLLVVGSAAAFAAMSRQRQRSDSDR